MEHRQAWASPQGHEYAAIVRQTEPAEPDLPRQFHIAEFSGVGLLPRRWLQRRWLRTRRPIVWLRDCRRESARRREAQRKVRRPPDLSRPALRGRVPAALSGAC